MENLDSLRPPRRGSGTGSEDEVMLPRSVSDQRALGETLDDSFEPASGQRVVEVHRTDDEMVRAVWRNYLPNKVVAAAFPGDGEAARIVPLLADRPQVHGKATAYVCRHYICNAPTNDPEEMARQLGGEQPTFTEV